MQIPFIAFFSLLSGLPLLIIGGPCPEKILGPMIGALLLSISPFPSFSSINQMIYQKKKKKYQSDEVVWPP